METRKILGLQKPGITLAGISDRTKFQKHFP